MAAGGNGFRVQGLGFTFLRLRGTRQVENIGGYCMVLMGCNYVYLPLTRQLRLTWGLRGLRVMGSGLRCKLCRVLVLEI